MRLDAPYMLAMAQWNPELLERYLAPEISTFTAATLPDVAASHPQCKHWIANHMLSSVFRAEYDASVKPLVLNILFRGQAAVRFYSEARLITLDFLERQQPHNPAVSLYFPAVAAWEATILNTQLAQDVMRRSSGTPAYTPGSNDDDERLWKIANRIKHCGQDIANGSHGPDLTVPIWLTNRGIVSRVAELTWEEMVEHVDSVASLADTISDPATAKEKHAKNLQAG